MTSSSPSAFAGHRFPREVISLAVRWYLRYGLSYRDVEELLAERGVTVDHVTVCRWVQRFKPEFVEAARTWPSHAPVAAGSSTRCRHQLNSSCWRWVIGWHGCLSARGGSDGER